MEFLNDGRERKPFECKIRQNLVNDYEVRVYLGNTAYKHEVGALVMAIEGCQRVSAWQRVDEDGEIFWILW